MILARASAQRAMQWPVGCTCDDQLYVTVYSGPAKHDILGKQLHQQRAALAWHLVGAATAAKLTRILQLMQAALFMQDYSKQ